MLVDIDGVSSTTRDKWRKLDISESIGLEAPSHVLSPTLADIDCVSSRTHAKRRILDILESIGLPSPSQSKLVDIDCNSRRRAKRRI